MSKYKGAEKEGGGESGQKGGKLEEKTM